MRFKSVIVTCLLLTFTFLTPTAVTGSQGTINKKEQAFVSEMRVIVPKLKKQTSGKILTIGKLICTQYEKNGRETWVTKTITKGLRSSLTATQAKLVIASATGNLCPISTPANPESATPSPTSPAPTVPTPVPTSQPLQLVLPENSGWQIVTSAYSNSKYLNSPVVEGTVLQLGNARVLGLRVHGFTCSGEWYDSAFIGIEFLDQNGNVIPGRFGLNKELLGYSAGRSDFSTAGCGSDDANLSDWPGAVALRVVSISGRTNSLTMFPGKYLT